MHVANVRLHNASNNIGELLSNLWPNNANIAEPNNEIDANDGADNNADNAINLVHNDPPPRLDANAVDLVHNEPPPPPDVTDIGLQQLLNWFRGLNLWNINREPTVHRVVY
ncbi:hypothetical protein TSUD_353020 [Trifolium subterraneum]|nr:hypothetical protein TSUD_353020 [Trifolium subterraneum]